MSAVAKPEAGLSVTAACARHGLARNSLSPRRWVLPGALPDMAVTVEQCADWITVETKLASPAVGASSPRRLVEWNSTLSGGTRFARDARGDLLLAAHVPVSEEGAEEAALHAAISGFRTAMSFYTGNDSLPQPVPLAADSPPGVPDVRALKPAFEEAGWPCAERQNNRLVVGLEGTVSRCQAVVHPTAAGGFRFAVELIHLDALPLLCQEAVTEFLLRACHVVRFCRASCLATDEGILAALEVLFGGTPCASALGAALESLSVGWSLCAAEVNALTDEAIAAVYLETGVGNPTNHNHRKDSSHGHVKHPEHHCQ